jgi:RNAse (barnase) inhibitor barstar
VGRAVDHEEAALLMAKPILEIDGSRFSSLEGFWDEVSQRLIPGAWWGRNLDAFDDILQGGFGTPRGGFTLRWLNFGKSQKTLGYAETVRLLADALQRCHPDSITHMKQRLEAARRGEGPTLADIIVEIIRIHGPGGLEERDEVELELV